MPGTSLLELYIGKIMTATAQRNYNMSVFTEAYRSNANSQQEKAEPITSRIQCGHTVLILKDDTGFIPSTIERCR